MHALNSLHVGLTRLAAAIAGLLMAAVAIVYVAEIIARYFLRAPLNFAADFGSYVLCISVFLCLPIITMEKRHIAIGFVATQIPPRSRDRYRIALFAVSALVLFIVGYFTVMETVRQFNQNMLTPLALQIPRWWLTSVASYGLISAAIHFLTAPSGSGHEFVE